MSDILRVSGIKHETTVPYSPQQNGVAERLNRTLVERARSMLMEAKLSPDLWAEAIATAVYLKNRSPTKALSDVTLEEAWIGQKPDLRHLRIFGYRALVKVPDSRRRKWDAKSQKYIFVGYCEGMNGYRLVHPMTKKLTRSRDVVFFEHRFSALDQQNLDPFPLVADHGDISQLEAGDLLQYPASDVQTRVEVGESDLNIEDPVLQAADDIADETNEQSLADDELSVTVESNDQQDVKDNTEVEVETRSRRKRIPNKRVFNDDFVNHACVNRQCDPITVEDALKSPNSENWKKAMEEEIQAHAENQTWLLSDLPAGRKAIKCKWVFKTKLDASRHVERYKARLVAKGCSQQPGVDYEETYAPVVRYTSIRLLMALGAKYDLDIDHMDVTTAFFAS